MSIHACTCMIYLDSQMLVCCLECLGSIAHVLKDLRVGLCILQSLSLELNGGQCAVNLLQLLLQTLFPLQSIQGS